MKSICSHEAKTRLPALLARVAKGESIVIPKRGEPIAMLVPPTPKTLKNTLQVIEETKALRNGNLLGQGLSIRGLMEEGR